MKIVLDTETTGLEPQEGHRIVEIGMVEIDETSLTGRTFQHYLNPERSMPKEAYAVHGLGDEFLRNQPKFESIADDLLDFIGEAMIVIHNADFDLNFLNAELSAVGRATISRHRVIDTLSLSRREFPKAARHSLDALCNRLKVDRSRRQLHGALLDAELLAEVYLAMSMRGRDMLGALTISATDDGGAQPRPGERPAPLAPLLTADEAAAHERFVETLGESALWHRFQKSAIEGKPK